MKLQGFLRTSLALAALFSTTFITYGAYGANIVIDFEAPLTGGLTPVSPIEGTPVPPQSLVASTYANSGVLMRYSALVNLGSGIAPSGVNGIMAAGPVFGDPGFAISSGVGMVFDFVSPSDPSVRASIDFFSITPVFLSDQHGPIKVIYYDPSGGLIGFRDVDPAPGTPIVVSGTTYRMGHVYVLPSFGSVAFDTLEFDPPLVPEPAISLLFALGFGVFLFKQLTAWKGGQQIGAANSGGAVVPVRGSLRQPIGHR